MERGSDSVIVTTETAGAVTIETRKELKYKNGPDGPDGSKGPKGPKGPKGRPYVQVTTTHRGPKAQVERLKWKKFGVGKYTTTICDDVYLEYTDNARKEEPWVANGFYITQARKDGWSDHEIKLVRKAERPDLKWKEIFFRKQDAAIATALAKVRATIKQEKEAAAARATRLNGGMTGAETEAETEAETDDKPTEGPVVVKGMSMKDLLKQKSQQRRGGTGSKGGGITAQLQKKREQRGDRKLTIYVQNVPTDWTEDDIAEQLTDFQIRRVSVTRKFNNVGVRVAVGSAFLELYEEDETERCITFLNDRCRWGSMVVSAQHARPKTQRR